MPQGTPADRQLIQNLIEFTGLTPSKIAERAKLAPSTLTRPFHRPNHHHFRLSQSTLDKLKSAFPDFPEWNNELPDLPDLSGRIEYVDVKVLPTFAGMGGGGTGDGDEETALVPRVLVESVLRGKPDDFLVVNVRGDSMEPDFRHGDQLLIDTRDTSPSQPGPFALWDGEWGEYVIKNVQRDIDGNVRIFSTNAKYASESAPVEQTRIIGRPVWFGRRL